MSMKPLNHPYGQQFKIDPVAFILALIGAPLTVTVALSMPLLVKELPTWGLMVVMVLVFGGPIYLLFGTPLLIWKLSQEEPKYSIAIAWAFLVSLGVGAVVMVLSLLGGSDFFFEIALSIVIFGPVFAVSWAAVFIFIYRKLRRPKYVADDANIPHDNHKRFT